VFNHVSSDSPYFDRYGHFDEVGACESVDSPYRDWFYFPMWRAGSARPDDGTPNHDLRPPGSALTACRCWIRDNPEVRDLVLWRPITPSPSYWLEQGGDGWRLDVMGDPVLPGRFLARVPPGGQGDRPAGRDHRRAVEEARGAASTRATRLIPAMNYRFRNAILGFFGTVDDKGFPDDGQSDQPPSCSPRS
jgi:glycosidase